MQWHKCCFLILKKGNSIVLCPQGPQADIKLRECSHMVTNNEALKLTFPPNWVNRGSYITLYNFYLYQIKCIWEIYKRKNRNMMCWHLIMTYIKMMQTYHRAKTMKIVNIMLQESTTMIVTDKNLHLYI